MHSSRKLLALVLAGLASAVTAQPAGPAAVSRVVASADYTTAYVQLGMRDADALLYRPTGTTSSIALIYAHPSGRVFGEPLGPQMAARGHLTIMVNAFGSEEPDDAYAPAISQAIRFLRDQPGVTKVVLVGHSGGGHLTAFYANAAENGPPACSGPEKLYPCRRAMVAALAKPDGLVLLDPTLGAFHQMSSIDPAWSARRRVGTLDMYAPANGYDPASKRATYSPAFTARFHAAQARRNSGLVSTALVRLRAIEKGMGAFSDDEPLLIEGMGVASAGARLYQSDTRLLSRTRIPRLLLKADGSEEVVTIRSVRPPLGQLAPEQRQTLSSMAQRTTVRRFLGSSAIRTGPGFAIGEASITGVDWRSAFSSTPGNAEGIRIPTLVLTMSCHYLIVPGEIVFDHLAATDKTYAAVEGATHLFAPCKPEYGDTAKRTFDFVEHWLEAGRFD